MKKFLFLILICFIVLFVYADTLTLYSPYIKDTIQLKKVIIDNSLSIETSHTKLIKDKDYSFNKGIIILFNTDYDTLKISYQIVKNNLYYENSKYEKITIEDSVKNQIVFYKTNKNNVNIGGIKGFFISVNNSGSIDINQSLELYLNGNMNENWKLKGYIYDNSANSNLNTYNIPISGIENLYINIYDSINMINLGNYSFNALNGTFNNKNREILGIAGKTKIKGYSVKGAIASQKGKLKTIEFYCIDGIQGPYSLIDNQILSDYIIAPGSEVIYLNGEKLKQGDEFDYIINYQTGEIYFTHKRPVDNNSYIYAEFQTYENANSINGYYFVSGNDSSKINFLFIREEAQIIDTSLLSIIKNTHTDSTYLNITGYEYVGDSNGNYILNDSIFEYVGYNNGNYIINFNYVGLGNGDYVYSPEMGAYIYAGKNQGNYSIYRKIDLPFESNYFSFNTLLNVYLGKILIESGGGFYKNNKYTSSYNKDASYSISFLSNNFNFNNFSLSFLFRKKYFSQFYINHWAERDRDNINFNNYLSSNNEIQNINSFEIKTKYSKYISTDYSFGILDSIKNHNFSIKTDSIFKTNTSVNTIIYTLNDSIIYRKNSFNILNSYLFLQPYYAYIKEEKQTKDLIKHTYTLYFNNKRNGLSYSRENDYNNDTLNLHSNIYKIFGNISFYNNITNVSIEYKHNNYYLLSSIANRLYAKISNIGLYEYIKYNNTLNFSSVSNIKQEETYIYVGEGKGEYVYDSLSNSYIYDEFEGDYIKIIENVFSTDPVARREYSFSFNSTYKYLNINTNYSYTDNAYSLFTLSYDSIENYNIFATNNISYDYYKNIIPFMETNYKKNNSIYNNYNFSNENKIGIYSITKLNYKLFYNLKNTIVKTDYSNQDFSSNSYNIELNLKNQNIQYNIEIQYEKFSGYYSDTYYDNIFIQLNKNSIQPGVKIKLYNNLYLGIFPEISIITYKDFYSEIPTIIYYNYPDGFSYKGNYYLNFLNNSVNISLKYINEYTKKYSYKHKVEISLYTYF